MDDKKVTIRISEELFKQFRIALITRNQTAQAVLEQAVKDYLKSEEGKEMKKWFVKMDDEFNSPIWWGEINLRVSKGDPFAKKLAEDWGVRGSKKEIMALVDYAKSIEGYYDGDERAPEAVLFGEVAD
jgi:predicted DNA binding CopG/RHH family protein